MKCCKLCFITQDLVHFEYGRHQCRTCRNTYRKKLKTRNGEGLRSYLLYTKYKLTLADYDRMLKEQKNVCKICLKEDDSNWKKLAVDHCHTTGKIRGLLCHKCNKGLGQFNDDTERMKIAIKYLKGEL